jgi:macrophage erythroblast attacher
LRLQQFIELAREGQQVDAIVHARKHLAGDQDPSFGLKAGGLLAHPSDTFVEPYRVSLTRICPPYVRCMI